MNNPPKTVIVTGASQGIGAGIVRAFLARGYNVVGTARNATKSRELSASDQLALIDGDIGQFETAHKVAELALKKFGSIDAVVANAGIFLVKPFTEYTAEDFRALVSTNLAGNKGAKILCRIFSERLHQEYPGIRDHGIDRAELLEGEFCNFLRCFNLPYVALDQREMVGS